MNSVRHRKGERGRWRRLGVGGVALLHPGLALLLPGLALLLPGLGCDAAPPRDGLAQVRALGRPHIVLVVVDTLRADALTPYAAGPRRSPELARWARHGVVFDRVLAQSSWTKVSMASIMTALWPRSHGVLGVRDALAQDALTLAESLRTGGYRTYAVQSNGWLESTFGFHQGFDHYVFARGSEESWMRSSVWPHAENVYEEAVRLVDRHDPRVPMFLYLHFMDVHEYAAPTEFQRFGSDGRGAYAAAVRWVDAVLESLRVHLADAGLLESSVLVLASDHGESFGENRSHGHARHVFTPVLRVPLVIRLPFETEGLRVEAQVRNLDIAPTLLDLAGLAVPAWYEGESLVPLLSDGARTAPRASYGALSEVLYRDARRQEAVNDGRWSFVRDLDGAGAEYLFDGAVDPAEDVNLVGIEHAEADRLRARLEAHAAAAPRERPVVSDVRIEPGLAKRLEALGYARP